MDTFSNVVDDLMTIYLMNMVALQWLRKLHNSLIEIVKTEYSNELRSNLKLADLVPCIAPNIDSFLRRYDQGGTTNKVRTAASQETDDDAQNVSKTFARGGAGFGSNTRGHGAGSSQGRGSGPFRARGGRQGSARGSGPLPK